jgi:hypothetical protein
MYFALDKGSSVTKNETAATTIGASHFRELIFII